MVVVIEVLVVALLFTLGVKSFDKDPIRTIYNYPPKIQERVKSLEQYKDRIPENKTKIATKLGFCVGVVLLISLIFKYINHYETFMQGFLWSYLMWTIVNWYDALIIDCFWFCHDKRWVIEGTEDMVDEYHNYMFHIKGSLIGQLIGLAVCLLIGLVVAII